MRAYVEFRSDSEEFVTEKVNHFLPKQLFFYLGNDAFDYGLYNGQVAFLNVNFGRGAFRLGKDLTHKDDIFGYQAGADKLVSKVKETSVSDKDVINVGFD